MQLNLSKMQPVGKGKLYKKLKGEWLQIGKPIIWLYQKNNDVNDKKINIRVMVDTFGALHNTVEVKLLFNPTEVEYLGTDASSSDYNTAANEEHGQGFVSIVRGNTRKLKGHNVFADVEFQAKSGSSGINFEIDQSSSRIIYSGISINSVKLKNVKV